MRILLINHYAGSPRHGMEYRPYHFAREWKKAGHDVSIVAASYSHLRSEQPSVRRPFTEDAVDGIPFVWLRTPSYRGNGAARARNIFSFVLRLHRYARRIVEKMRPDVVIASSTYPLDVYPARRMASLAGALLVHEIHDLWPLTLVELAGIKPYHPFVALLQAAENYSCRVSHLIVSMLPRADEHLMAHGMEPAKYVHIPNGVDLEVWKSAEPIPEEHEAAIAELRGKGVFLVGYAGGHGVSNALDIVIDAAALLDRSGIAFVLVGQGPEKEALRERAASRCLSNVFFLSPVKRVQIPDLLSRFDVLFHAMRPSPIYRFGINPNKLFDYMMAGKPVIQAVNACNDMVKEADCGITVPPGDARALAEGIMALKGMSEYERRCMGERGKTHVLAEYDVAKLACRFADILEEKLAEFRLGGEAR
ncbi:MAG: glycosyltransferase family 4 protein [Bacteroidota bacterium]|nr:glycosyltransferase family 4 protein [Bacteroidota bacterium]